VTLFLRDLAVNDMSSLTCRGYTFDLLRWFRFLWSSTSGGHQSWSDSAGSWPADRANQLSIRPPEVNARFLYGLPGVAIVGVEVGSPVGVTGEFEPAGLWWQDGSGGSASADGAGLGSALNAEVTSPSLPSMLPRMPAGTRKTRLGVAGHLSRLRAMTFPSGI